jgi:hypothetical protein
MRSTTPPAATTRTIPQEPLHLKPNHMAPTHNGLNLGLPYKEPKEPLPPVPATSKMRSSGQGATRVTIDSPVVVVLQAGSDETKKHLKLWAEAVRDHKGLLELHPEKVQKQAQEFATKILAGNFRDAINYAGSHPDLKGLLLQPISKLIQQALRSAAMAENIAKLDPEHNKEAARDLADHVVANPGRGTEDAAAIIESWKAETAAKP